MKLYEAWVDPSLDGEIARTQPRTVEAGEAAGLERRTFVLHDDDNRVEPYTCEDCHADCISEETYDYLSRRCDILVEERDETRADYECLIEEVGDKISTILEAASDLRVEAGDLKEEFDG